MSAFVIVLAGGFALMLIGAVAKAFALPIASSTVRAWVWLVSLGLPAEVKNTRRAEIAADLWEHQEEARAAGYGPDAIGVQMFFRLLVGMPADVSWRLGHAGLGYVLLVVPVALAGSALLVAHSGSLLIVIVRVMLGVGAIALLIAVVACRRLLFAKRQAALWATGQHSLDYVLLLAIAALLVVGLLQVYSASFAVGQVEYGDTNYFIARHAGFALVGVLLLWTFMKVDYHHLRSLSIGMMAIALVGLLAVLMPGLGLEQNGVRRSLALGPLPSLQPSEFAKLAIIVYISAWLASRSHGDDLKHFWAGFLPFVLMIGLVASLVVVEPDMGTTIIIVLTTCTLFFVAGASHRHLLLLIVGAGLISCGIILLANYPLERIFSLIAPGEDPDGSSFHVRHLLDALGSGGVAGLGWGSSSENPIVPSGHTHGIFAVLGREVGFLGIVCLIGLYLFLVYRAFRVSLTAPDRLGSLLALGIACWIAYQTLINIAGITRSIPLTEVPLPLISYGGSHLLATLVGLGVLLGISRQASTADPRVSVNQPVSQ